MGAVDKGVTTNDDDGGDGDAAATDEEHASTAGDRQEESGDCALLKLASLGMRADLSAIVSQPLK